MDGFDRLLANKPLVERPRVLWSRFVSAADLAATAAFTRIVGWRSGRALEDGPSTASRPLRILFVRSGAIGDVMVALGPMRAVAAARPGSTIDVVGPPEIRELTKGLPYIGRVFPVDRRGRMAYYNAALSVRRQPAYDVAIDAHTSGDRLFSHAALLLKASRAPIRVGSARSHLGRALTHVVRPREADDHWVEYMVQFFAPVLGVRQLPPDIAPRLLLSSGERDAAEAMWGARADTAPRVLINVATGARWKRWPPERFEAVGKHIRRRHPTAPIIVIGHGAASEAVAIATSVGGRHLVTTFRELIALVATADLVISPDTAVSHVAAAFDRILVSIHARGTEAWRPYRARGRQLFSSSGLTLNFVSVAQVVDAVDSALEDVF